MKFNVQDLIDQGLVKAKEYPNGLKVLKYSRQVFFKNLWHKDERLLECRGRVVDADWNVIVNPFTKTFNYGENHTGEELPNDFLLRATVKLNGYLGNVTRTDGYGVLYSTTGTLDSDYAKLLKKEFRKRYMESKLRKNVTYMFEVCHQSDPHIVHEKPGLYLIGMRCTDTGKKYGEQFLDKEAREQGFKRPVHLTMSKEELLIATKEAKHEGFMATDIDTREHLFKLKSPYYLSKKLLMRLGKARVEQLFDNPEKFKKNLKDEEFFGFVDYVAGNTPRDVWKSMPEQERRNLIECWFDKNNAF